MSDFQDALGQLVERQTPDSVAPFTVLQQRRARRVRRRAVVVSCAAVVALAFGAAAVAGVVDRDEAGPATTDPAYRVDGPAPQRITVEGVELELSGAAEFHSARLSPASRTALLVEAGANPPRDPHPCRLWTTMRVLRQDATSVRIGAFSYRPPDPGRERICTLVGYAPTLFTLELGAPLGDRALVDDSSGEQAEVVDPGDSLAATYLPAGYSSPGMFQLNTSERKASGVTLWTHQGPARASIEIYQGPPNATPSLTSGTDLAGETVFSRPTVRGREGEIFRPANYAGRLCLTWPESAKLTVNICSLGDPAPLRADELVRIAEGLSRSNDRPIARPSATPSDEPSATPTPPVTVVPAPSREPQGQYGGDTYDRLGVIITGAYKNTENTILDIYVDVVEQGSRVLSYDVDFGDGTTMSGRPTTTCPKPQEQYTERYTFRRTYPDGFRSTFTIRIRTGDCETAGESTVQTFEVVGGVRQGTAT